MVVIVIISIIEDMYVFAETSNISTAVFVCNRWYIGADAPVGALVLFTTPANIVCVIVINI